MLIALCSLLLSVHAGTLRAQDESERAGALTGHVLDAATERPIVGALVEVVGTESTASTDESGRFVLREIPVGVFSVRIRAIGYEPYLYSNVVIGTGKPTTVQLKLVAAPVEVDPLNVTASYFGRTANEASTSTAILGSEAIRRAPGVQEDVIRAVALLPGIGVTTGGRNDLTVRGGAPYENLFIVDGLEVPNLNHFGSQGSTGGPLAIVDVEFVEEVGVSAGGFGPRYGDRSASVTNITLRDGNEDRLSGTANLSATGFGLIGEGPVGAGSFLLGVRRSYLDLLFRVANFSFVPAYWDFQLKTTQRISARNSISLLAVGALDDISFNNETADNRFDNSRILAPNQKQYFTGLTWKHLLDRGLLSVTAGRTYVNFESFQQDSLLQTVFLNRSAEGENTVRVDLTLTPIERLEITAGNVVKFADNLSYEVAVDGSFRFDEAGRPRPMAIDTSFSALRNGAYVRAAYLIGGGVRAEAGLRADYYGYLNDDFELSPRFGLAFDVDERSTIGLSAGRYVQPPSYIWLIGDPGNPDRLSPFRSDQAVLSFAHLPRPDLQVRVEGFVKRYTDYVARIWRPEAVLAPAGFEDVTYDIPFGLEPLVSSGSGRAFGGELFVQKKLSEIPLYGLVSLSFSRSEFRGLDEADRPGAYDTRVIGTALAGYRFNSAWEVSGKFRIASGRPTTPFIEVGPQAGRLDFSRYNELRFPTFNALDVRVDRTWNFRTVRLEVYLDVQNVYGRQNVDQVFWNARTGEAEPEESLGILPSIGVNVTF
jgi:hypothetical protein